MQTIVYVAAAAMLFGGAARAANMCQAGTLSCSTTMPPGGYCECTAHGATKSGTVVAKAAAPPKANAAPAGCSARSTSPGCSGPK